MTASSLVQSQVLSTRLKGDGSGSTSTYHGRGYTYHLHKTAQDIWAKLQIARSTMTKFVKRVGACNTVNLPGLNVCDQGNGGWFEIFVIDERKLWTVVNFLKRLNRWMLEAHVIKVPNKKHHYFVETRKFLHTPPKHLKHAPYVEDTAPKPPPKNPLSVQSQMVPTSRLQHLAATVNSRFGH